jgi:hypothetical protein
VPSVEAPFLKHSLLLFSKLELEFNYSKRSGDYTIKLFTAVI